MAITRRALLKDSALALVATTAIPAFLTRAVAAQAANATARGRLIVFFQRGAADGLNTIVPHGDPAYYALRPTLAIPRPGARGDAALELDGFFGLHPSLAPLAPLYARKQLAIVHASGSPHPTRSHFEAQDYMESGTPGVAATADGWLNRCVASDAPDPCSAVAIGSTLPRILAGRAPAIALDRFDDFAVRGGVTAERTFERMYAGSGDVVLHAAAERTFDAVHMLESAAPARYAPRRGAEYPRGDIGQSLQQIAQLLRADLGVRVAFADAGGWDHHVNEGAVQGPLANRLSELARAIAAFWVDLGDLAEDTVLVTLSEFGRTAGENGNGGTDHGHANAMLVLGGRVKGGRVYGEWPGLAPEQLYEGRDLALTTDFRRVLGELVARTLGSHLEGVFPGFDPAPESFLQILA
jgi:uncharacterized protein (DUF1501 family)